MVETVICTLFEGHFHCGLAALANSLYASGYRGTICAGYRGALPPWATPLQKVNGSLTFHISEDFRIRFLPVPGDRHLTNCKPHFMLQILGQLETTAGRIVYFDPDVTVQFPWSFFEDWMSDSVALCEDVNSPMPDNHPKRNGWRRFFQSRGIQFRNQSSIYINGGFVGLPRALSGFLQLWSAIIEMIAESGLDLSSMGTSSDYRFWFYDQDALNVAVMATDCPMSFAGKEGMGFLVTHATMLHATGVGKPWNTSILRNFLDGKPFTQAHREYWRHVESPIPLFSSSYARRRRTLLGIAALGGRFYRR